MDMTHDEHKRETRTTHDTSMDYRAAIIRLLSKVKDEELIRRVWRLLDSAYNKL